MPSLQSSLGCTFLFMNDSVVGANRYDKIFLMRLRDAYRYFFAIIRLSGFAVILPGRSSHSNIIIKSWLFHRYGAVVQCYWIDEHWLNCELTEIRLERKNILLPSRDIYRSRRPLPLRRMWCGGWVFDFRHDNMYQTHIFLSYRLPTPEAVPLTHMCLLVRRPGNWTAGSVKEWNDRCPLSWTRPFTLRILRTAFCWSRRF